MTLRFFIVLRAVAVFFAFLVIAGCATRSPVPDYPPAARAPVPEDDGEQRGTDEGSASHRRPELPMREHTAPDVGDAPGSTVVPVPHIPWRPPTTPAPAHPSESQVRRMTRYYGLASSRELPVEVRSSVVRGDPAVGVDVVGAKLDAARPVSAERPWMDRSLRAHLAVHLSGEQRSSARNTYGRAVLDLRYQTGPGRRLERSVRIVGPFRLSRFSGTDAILTSLHAIDPETVRRGLGALDQDWREDARLNGLPYVVTLPPREHHAALIPVLRSMGRRAPDGGWFFFDTPPMIAQALRRHLAGSPYGYSVDPLTGNVRIVYNDNT